ncbi:MAG: hypothetical protein ACQEQI_05890, partial [Bacillota bacterium]
EEVIRPIREKYGALKEDTSLEELIGDSHIHPWLEGAITTAQKREAAVVKELNDKFADRELLLEVYHSDGAKLAAKLSNEEQVNLQQAFELLKSSFLERMPCDQLSTVDQSDKQIIWQHESRLHTEFWQQVGVSLELMHQLYQVWIEGSATELNSKIKYQRQIEEDYYQDIFSL